MDDLAHDLGVSKKTLYAHFPSKEAIADTVVDFIAQTMRSRFDTILNDPKLSFAEKLCAVIETIRNKLSKISPAMLHDLQRFAPVVYQKVDELRKKNIPYVFGRLLRDGIEAGMVRPDLDVEFATEFWLQAIRGLVDPETLDRLQLTPRQIIDKSVPLFYGGLLTAKGRKEYERLRIDGKLPLPPLSQFV